MRILGGDYLLVLLLVRAGYYLASVLCACFLNPDGIRFALMLHSFAAVALIVVIMVRISTPPALVKT